MGNVRFWRRFKIAPGVTLNISKTGFSFSFGPQGAKATIGTSGGRFTVGIPGTGLFYTHKFGSGKGKSSASSGPDQPEAASAGAGVDEAKLEAAARAEIAPPEIEQGPRIPLNEEEQQAFSAACDVVAEGDEARGLQMLSSLNHHPDAAFLSGLLLLRADEDHGRAASLLRSAFANQNVLGHAFEECGRELSLELPITDEVSVRLGPDPLGAALAYVEALQRLDRIAEGVAVLEQLAAKHPNHPLIAMSLADLRAP